jgi:hypothetical protein
MALTPDHVLFVSNDDDFGITTGAVGTMIQKILPATGEPDFVELFPLRMH